MFASVWTRTSTLRIGGGTANRRTLHTVAGRRVRPTSGRVRQALFNMLRPQIADAIVVDLFAGTGSVGLEALSQGAGHVYFIEQDRQVLRVLRANMLHCDMEGRATIIDGTLPQALNRLPASLQADLLFLDPPYASTLAEDVLTTLASSDRLARPGIVAWQHAVRHLAPAQLLGLSLWQRRRYGETMLSLYASAD